MKRIRIFISVALLLVTLTGCGTQKSQNNDSQTNNDIATEATTNNVDNNTKTNTSSDVKDKDSNTKKDGTITNSNKTEKNTNTSTGNTTKENSKGQKSFYGNWQIKKVAGYAKVSTGENESLIGLKITLSKDSATLGDQSYDNPKYTIINQSKDKIASSLNTNLSDIGVNANSIDELNVLNKNGTEEMTLFIKDTNTLIYYLDGTYYETTRIS